MLPYPTTLSLAVDLWIMSLLWTTNVTWARMDS